MSSLNPCMTAKEWRAKFKLIIPRPPSPPNRITWNLCGETRKSRQLRAAHERLMIHWQNDPYFTLDWNAYAETVYAAIPEDRWWEGWLFILTGR